MSSTPTTERFSRAGEDASQGDQPPAVEQAQRKAQEGAEKAKGAMRTQVDERSTALGQQLGTHAQDARTVAEELRKQGKEAPAKAAEQAADRAEKLGGYLERSDADRILSDVEDYARSNPWAVVAGGMAAGFLASRFLKASSAQRQSAAPSSRPQLDPGSRPAPSPSPSPVASSPAPSPSAPTTQPPPAPPAGVGGASPGVGTTSVPGRPIGG